MHSLILREQQLIKAKERDFCCFVFCLFFAEVDPRPRRQATNATQRNLLSLPLMLVKAIRKKRRREMVSATTAIAESNHYRSRGGT